MISNGDNDNGSDYSINTVKYRYLSNIFDMFTCSYWLKTDVSGSTIYNYRPLRLRDDAGEWPSLRGERD